MTLPDPQTLVFRSPAAEIMDSSELSEAELRGALRGLRRINALSRTAHSLWPAIERECRLCAHPVRMLDMACGGGDVAARLATRARKQGLQLKIEGCDRNPLAVRFAQESAAAAGLENVVRFYSHDVLESGVPDGYDIVISTLFLHHLRTEEAVSLLLETSRKATRLALTSDLLRTRTGLLLARAATRAVTTSRVVHADGMTSVYAAFSFEEVRELAQRAALHGASLRRVWPERFLLSWRRQSS